MFMATGLQLHHVGEPLLRHLLDGLRAAGRLESARWPIHAACDLGSIFARERLHAPFTFRASVPLRPVEVGGQQLLFDGAHGVDVLALTG